VVVILVRKGRSFEELIALLEDILSGFNIKVTSPDFYIDKDTGLKREIDISLKGNFGSYQIFIIIECRDHKRVQGVAWIEQIATKRDAVNANLAVAVSSSGFTEDARKKAIALNIELRTFESINPEEIKAWFQANGLNCLVQHYKLIEILVVPEESLVKSEKIIIKDFVDSFSNGGFNTTTKFVYDPEIDHLLCIDDFIKNNAHTVFSGITFNGEKTTIEITLGPTNADKGFFVETPKDKIKIKCILAKLEIWIEIIQRKITDISAYQNEKGIVGHVVSFEGTEINGKRRFVEIIRIPQGEKQYFGVRLKESNEK